MNIFARTRLTSFILFFSFVSVGPLTFADELKCEHIPQIVKVMLNRHYLYNDFTKNIEMRAIDQYIKALDPSKLYFQESDVKKNKADMKNLFAQMSQAKSCKILEDIQANFVKRLEERTKYAEKYLGEKFKLIPTTEIQLDADKREFPKNEKKASEFQEKYIQWQVANFVATDMPLNEAKQQILRRYQRSLKMIKEQKVPELYSYYLEAVARALDPHSSFLSKDTLEDFEISMKLSLEGIGATLSSQDGYTVIEQLVPGGAAATSGLLETQDKIVAVGQGEAGAMEAIIDLPLRDVVKQIRGHKGT